MGTPLGGGDIDREGFDRETAEVFRDAGPVAHGIHGPDSISWRVGREAALFLGGGRAALLQLAHPFVAHGVDEHSATRTDPIGRFDRTFRAVHAIVFGDLGHARGASERVRRIHEGVRGRIDERVGAFRPGDAYSAHDVGALLWVHATLVDTAVQVYDLVVAPLSADDKDAYWRESKRFARLFGIPRSALPDSWSDFQAWFRGALASETLTVGTRARELGRFLLTAPKPASVPLVATYRVLTAGLLPAPLREAYKLRFGRRERALFRGAVATLRTTHPLLPRRLRFVPAYVEAMRRLNGDPAPDRFGRRLERLALGLVAPPGRPVK